MTDYLKTPLDSLLETIDFTKIYDELYKIPGAVTSGELWAETHELILLALETWLARDVQEFTNVKIETPYNEGKIIIDLEADCRGTIAPFKKYNNCKILLDWKTTQSPSDTCFLLVGIAELVKLHNVLDTQIITTCDFVN